MHDAFNTTQGYMAAKGDALLLSVVKFLKFTQDQPTTIDSVASLNIF